MLRCIGVNLWVVLYYKIKIITFWYSNLLAGFEAAYNTVLKTPYKQLKQLK